MATLSKEFEGKRVLVTAAANGIGRAIAAAFWNAGAEVHVCDIDSAALEERAKEMPGLAVYPADVGDPDAVDRLFDQVHGATGGLDILVNNAGIAGPTGPIEDCAPADWRRCQEVTLDGTYLCIRRALPAMKAAGAGSIVNISSTAGVMGYPFRTPYAAAKWAVVGLTKSLAMEVGPLGIRVNAICPGSISGPRMDRVIANEAIARGQPEEVIRKGYVAQASLRTFIEAEDIASMALFICSDAGAKITGQALCVDGNNETLATGNFD